MKMKCEKWLLTLVFSAVCASAAVAASKESQDKKFQAIKRQALELNRDLVMLEEEMLFPNDSRLMVYLSLDAGDFLPLDAITLSIDGNQVKDYQYSDQQLDALRRGGAHRLYTGTVETGEHRIVAVFTGKSPEGRDYRVMTEHTLETTSGATNLELKVIASTSLQQPEFSIKEW